MAGGLSRRGLLPVCHHLPASWARAPTSTFTIMRRSTRGWSMSPHWRAAAGRTGAFPSIGARYLGRGGVPGLVALSPRSEREVELAARLGLARARNGQLPTTRERALRRAVRAAAGYRLAGRWLRAARGRDALSSVMARYCSAKPGGPPSARRERSFRGRHELPAQRGRRGLAQARRGRSCGTCFRSTTTCS